MNKGSFTYDDYFKLLQNNNIIYKEYKLSQIQPSSIDLTLSEECYEIKASFLSPNCSVREKLDKIIKRKINLNTKYVFKKNKTYIVKLNEKLNLTNIILVNAIPKVVLVVLIFFVEQF